MTTEASADGFDLLLRHTLGRVRARTGWRTFSPRCRSGPRSLDNSRRRGREGRPEVSQLRPVTTSEPQGSLRPRFRLRTIRSPQLSAPGLSQRPETPAHSSEKISYHQGPAGPYSEIFRRGVKPAIGVGGAAGEGEASFAPHGHVQVVAGFAGARAAEFAQGGRFEHALALVDGQADLEALVALGGRLFLGVVAGAGGRCRPRPGSASRPAWRRAPRGWRGRRGGRRSRRTRSPLRVRTEPELAPRREAQATTRLAAQDGTTSVTQRRAVRTACVPAVRGVSGQSPGTCPWTERHADYRILDRCRISHRERPRSAQSVTFSRASRRGGGAARAAACVLDVRPPAAVSAAGPGCCPGGWCWCDRGGCATADEEGKGVTYSLTAKQNYEKGLEELKDENFAEATRYFSFVKQKFPFSSYAVLAELALADTQFARGNYQEAIDAYKTFARLHPTHEKVEDGYVAFKICRLLRAGDAGRLVPGAAGVREGSDRGARRLPRAVGLPRQISRFQIRHRRQETAAGGDGRASSSTRCTWPASISTPATRRRRSCGSRRRSGGIPSRGARRSCCWCSGRPTWRWATRGGRGDVPAGDQGATARRCRPGGRSCTSSSSANVMATTPRTARTRRPDAQWMSARAACCSAVASTTRATNTTRPSAAWCSWCATTTPSPTSTTCWGSSTTRRG